MLLWPVLHLTETKAVNADYELVGRPSVSLDDIRRFRQLDSNLCWVYDNNHITIEGNTQITFTEDIAARFLG